VQTLEIIEGPRPGRDAPAISVAEYIRSRARTRPADVAIIDADDGRHFTCAEVDRLSGRVAAGLAALGFAPGDRLLMFAPNSPEWAITGIGAIAAGGIVSGANPTYGPDELANQMRDVGARFIFTAPGSLATVRAAAAHAGNAKIILVGDAPGTVPFASLLACTDPEPEVTIDPDALAALPYSSGTAGPSKGVILTHRAIISNLCQVTDALGFSDNDVALCVLPMYHIYGFTVISLGRLAAGGTLVTLSRFEPESFLRAIERYRVTHLSLVPPLLLFLATHPLVDDFDLSSLTYIGSGAAPLGEQTQRKVAERLNCPVVQGFGMTESSGVVSVTHTDRIRPGSSGQLLPGTQARIVDPVTGADLPRGTAGELWFRGPQAFKGYLHAPQATADTITPDGWVRTGDVGYFDADGYLFITDRIKELIKVKGFQVPPAELEALLLTHPAILDAAVIGRPDERAGELPVAYVVRREPATPEAGAALDADALKAWVAERVVDYKRLGDVVFTDKIPKSPSGKILRRVLREADRQG